MELKDIKDHSWIIHFADIYYCPHCLLVSRDASIGFVGSKCKNCDCVSDGAHIYFSHTVFSLIDLIQDFYLTPFKISYEYDIPNNTFEPSANNQLAIIIFFCTLGEVLLLNLLEWIMKFMDIPKDIQKRLLDDNLYMKQRIERLFPSLVGEKWNFVIKDLSDSAEIDYVSSIDNYLDAVETRNNILHSGAIWSLSSEMSDKCIDNIWPLTSLFVDLHNRYLCVTSSD